jgi:hypothetical protein
MAWTSLKYDTNLGGDRVRVTEDQLKDAPKYNRNTEWDWTDRAATKQSMTIIAHRFGTLDMIKRLGENPPSFL